MDTSELGLICKRDVVTAALDESPWVAADRMRSRGVGCLIVLGHDGAPVGMLTDRDLALRVVAHGSGVDDLAVGDVMSSPLMAVEVDEGLDAVYAIMRREGVRRVAVLEDGALVGILSMDDLVQELAREMEDLGKETRTRIDRAALGRLQNYIDRRLGEVSRRLQATHWIARDELLSEVRRLRHRVRDAGPE